MSEFSGKCDFCDHVWDKDDDYFARSDFYVYTKGREHKLEINNKHDAIKYYPFLIGFGGFEKDRANIHISSDSFIDVEERERLKSNLAYVLRYWRRCKRKKVRFDKNEALKEVSFIAIQDYEREIVERVAKYGDKAVLDDIHIPMHEYYRKRWYEHMVENGYPEKEAFCWIYKVWYVSDEVMKMRLDACKL